MKYIQSFKLLTFILGLLLLSGCAVKPFGPPPEDLIIAFSADSRAELYKCGCKGAQLGGLGRLGTAVKEMGTGAKVLIDCGNFAPPSAGVFYDMKSDAVIETYNFLGYDAVNLGTNEINLGKDYIVKTNEAMGRKIVSANVLGLDGNPIVQPYITKDFGSLRVGIIGLVYHQTYLANQPRAQESGVITRDPIEALDTYIPEMKKREKCDLIIVAGWLQQTDIEKIAEKFDGKIDVILTGYGYRQSDRNGIYAYYYSGEENPEPSGEEPVIKRDEENKKETSIILHGTGNLGKFIGKIFAPIVKDERGSLKLGEFEGATIELGENMADDPEINAILARFHARVRENIDSMIGEVMSQQPRDFCEDYTQYVGNRWCSECHQNQHVSYSRSAHNRAMQTLNLQKEQNNPECLLCHTTGYGEPGGFRNTTETYHLALVGCESCHGPAKEHLCFETNLKEAQQAQARNMATPEQISLIGSGTGDYDHKISKEVAEAICLKCHTPKWDPTFNYITDILLVSHIAAEEPVQAPAAGTSNVVGQGVSGSGSEVPATTD